MDELKQKQNGVFYGWWIVGACFLISLCVQGIIGMGFTAFIGPLHGEFGWSYAQIAIASSLRGLEVGLLAPLAGLLVDRYGPRGLIMTGAILAGLGLVLLSRVNSLATYYGVFIIIALGASAISPTVTMAAVANWFRKKVGLATGIMHSGVGFSGLMVPLVVLLVDGRGWQTAAIILGLSLTVAIFPLAILVRHRPEKYGLLPDGDSDGMLVANDISIKNQYTEESIEVKEALRTGAFWRITIALMCHLTMVITVATHVMPYLESLDISRTTASFMAAAIPLVSVIGRVGFGWLGDRMERKRVMAVGYGMMGLGMLLFAGTGYLSIGLFIPFIILFGIGFGGNAVMRAGIVRECFGRRNFGTILGFMSGIGIMGQLVGPPLAGWVFDEWGSYQGVWLAFALLSVVPAIMIATLSKPRRRGIPLQT